MWYQVGQQVLSLPLQSLDINSSFNVSTASFTITLQFLNTSGKELAALFLCPTRATVLSASVLVGQDRNLETAYIPSDELKDLKVDDVKSETIPKNLPHETFVSDLFRLPVTSIKAGESINISIQCIEPLEYDAGKYVFRLPLRFAPELAPRGPLTWCKIHAEIFTFGPQLMLQSDTHALQVTPGVEKMLVDALSPSGAINDFHLSYWVQTESIMGSLLVEAPTPDPMAAESDKGSFLLLVSPPTESKVIYPRDFVFLIDRSGSMGGSPFNEALNALSHALNRLAPCDRFTIKAFDHEIAGMPGNLQMATEENKSAALTWLRNFQPRGATDIFSAVKAGLRSIDEARPISGPAPIPFIFLLTDGCVENEREICQFAQQSAANVRIMTLGLGTYCNWYFLRMLSQMSGGFTEAVTIAEELEPKATRLMKMSSQPLLRDIRIGVEGVADLEIFPDRIPDLYLGAPLLLSGFYKGVWPAGIRVFGVQADGATIAFDIGSGQYPGIPVRKVCLKQRIDMLTARAWYLNDDKLKEQIKTLSVTHSMPSPYTTMVAYETKKTATEQKQQPQQHKPMSSAAVAAAAVGGVVVLGVALASFGDVGATLGNIGTGIGDLLKVGEIAGCCSDMFSSIGNLVCGSCGSCGGCGDVCGSIGSSCGSIGSCLNGGCGDVCGCLSQCGGNAGDCLCKVVSAIGPILQSLGSCLGSICSILGSLDC